MRARGDIGSLDTVEQATVQEACVARHSRQKPRFLTAATELMSEKAPQAIFSH
jgi:hypothetical protein